MRQIEVKAKTAIEAIEEACEKLGVSQDRVNVEILSQGGMFGKMKVLVTVKEEYEADAPHEVAPVASTAEKTENKNTPNKTSSKDSEPTKQKVSTGEDKTGAPSNSAQKQHDSDAKRRVKKSEDYAPKAAVPAADAKPADPNSPKFVKTVEFTKKLLDLLDNDSTIKTEMTDQSFNINIDGENIGRLIGKNGIVLNAIQNIVSSIAISNSNGEGKRVYVNIGNYREKRGDSLLALAHKKAEYVRDTGRFVKLEPMNARERAIIHTELQGFAGVKTYSTGRDPFRCLCIAPADKADKEEPKEE